MSRIPPAKATAPPGSVLELVQRFAQHQETYKQQAYNETRVRREFIDPFFKALGWDVDNRAGYAEAYKDVIHEDAIKVGASTKAPDYCFRIGGVRKFFVEAKKPSVAVKDDPGPAYQLRRYAWTAKLPLAIVTDFEEFAVYDCRIRPRPTDKPSTARVKYLTYDQYADRWEEIAAIFTKEAILQGSFDKYAESNRRKRGTAEVDTEFLKEIEQWRELLARNIALRNPRLSVRELNYAVSKTIDRIIFLRMCEDRGVETYAQLRILPNGPNIYPRLIELFRRADERYNSGLFHFEHEKGRTEEPDTLTPGLTIDDKVLKDIIKRLYYPECPYEFSVMPSEILGQVYEQFLGKVITLTAGHRAKIESKPEVKKAGGVYYTPKYIVDYIVAHTVGKLLGDQGSGVGDQGPGVAGTSRGNQNVSGPGGVAKGDGSGRGGVPGEQTSSHRRAIRADGADSTGGRVGSGKHRRGAREDSPKGVSAPSLVRQGVADGTGNPPDDRGTPETSAARRGCGDLGAQPGSRAAAERTDSGTAERDGGSGARDSKKEDGTSSPPPGPRSLTPKEASTLRILDPACGSGSFLLGAYQYLLDWHSRWYAENDPEAWAKKKNPPIYQIAAPDPNRDRKGAGHRRGQGPGTGDQGPDAGEAGNALKLTPDPRPLTPNYRLTVAERKRILLNNIFGVDIDPQAVEVTKLSLLLKVLEGESQQTLDNQLRLFHERALPDLGANIKCGNSLIGPDFYDGKQLDLLDDEERYRINVFDWEAEFPEVFARSRPSRKQNPDRKGGTTEARRAVRPQDAGPLPHGRGSECAGGFDAVIGNPPYVRMETFTGIKTYLRERYSAHQERADIYAYFLERGLALLDERGHLGMIVSNKFIRAKYGAPLREVLTGQASIETIADFAGAPVFRGATVRTVVLFAGHSISADESVARYVPVPSAEQFGAIEAGWLTVSEYANSAAYVLPASSLGDREWNLAPQDSVELVKKLRNGAIALSDYVGHTALFGLKTGFNKAFVIGSQQRAQLIRDDPKSIEVIKPILFGKDIRRYGVRFADRFVIYCHPDKRIDSFPAVNAHLSNHRTRLLARAGRQEWYELQQPAVALIPILTNPKIVYPIIANECRFSLETEARFVNDKAFVLASSELSLLGLLNSQLAKFYFDSVCAALEGATDRYLEFRAQYVDCFPVSPIFPRPKAKLEGLVDRMLGLHKQLDAAKTPTDKTAIQRQIDATDRQIDNLVYKLYDLTDDEIRIVEDATKER